MARKNEPVDNLLDALVWMRRKAKRHEPVDDLIDSLIRMRRKAGKHVAKRKKARKTKKTGAQVTRKAKKKFKGKK